MSRGRIRRRINGVNYLIFTQTAGIIEFSPRFKPFLPKAIQIRNADQQFNREAPNVPTIANNLASTLHQTLEIAILDNNRFVESIQEGAVQSNSSSLVNCPHSG